MGDAAYNGCEGFKAYEIMKKYYKWCEWYKGTRRKKALESQGIRDTRGLIGTVCQR